MISTQATDKGVRRSMQVRVSVEDWKRLKKIMHREELDTLGLTVKHLIDRYYEEVMSKEVVG